MTDLKTIIASIHMLEQDELTAVIEAVKLRRQYISKTNIRQLMVGDSVEFVARNRMIRGTVSKINRKTVMIRENAPAGMYATTWRVPAVIVRAVEKTG